MVQSVLAMGSALPSPDTPVTFGTGLVDDYDDNSGVWYNLNDGGQPGYFQYRYRWLPSAVADAPPLAEILDLGLGPPEIKIRLRVSGTTDAGTGVSVRRENGTSIGIGTAAFVPAGSYPTPTWFQSVTYTVATSSNWDAWRTGDIAVNPITGGNPVLKIYEVEITASWPEFVPLVIEGQIESTRIRVLGKPRT